MKKFLVAQLFIPLFSHSAQNFNRAKTKLIQLYKSNPEQPTFFAAVSFHGQARKVSSISLNANMSQGRISIEHLVSRGST